jgi:hypothetical protein
MKLLLGRLKPKKGELSSQFKRPDSPFHTHGVCSIRFNFFLKVKNYDFTVTISLLVLSEMRDHFVEALKNNVS